MQKKLTLAAILLAGSALAQSPAGPSGPLSATVKPTVDQLAPVEPILGIQVGTRLPTECGGGELPTDLALRLKAIETCTADLEQREKLEKKLGDLRKAGDGSGTTGFRLPVTESAVSLLNAKPGTTDVLQVKDEGDKGISTDDGRRRPPPGAANSAAIADISSLSELTLVGGGCGDVCVAIFRAGEKTVSVQRIGEPIALNAQVTAITGKGSNISVTVTLRKPGVAPATKEFRL